MKIDELKYVTVPMRIYVHSSKSTYKYFLGKNGTVFIFLQGLVSEFIQLRVYKLKTMKNLMQMEGQDE